MNNPIVLILILLGIVAFYEICKAINWILVLQQQSKKREEERSNKTYYINIYRSTQNGNKPFTDGHCWTSKEIAIDLRRKDVPLYQVYQETISIQIED